MSFPEWAVEAAEEAGVSLEKWRDIGLPYTISSRGAVVMFVEDDGSVKLSASTSDAHCIQLIRKPDGNPVEALRYAERVRAAITGEVEA